MSNRKLVKVVKILHRRISRLFVSLRKIGSNIWGVLRTLLLMGRPRPGTSTAGFVLPTVVMVTMVVILLTTAILFRSFERSQNASNVRVNEMTLKAATPALDRARAKLDKLFADGRLPRATPNDTALYETFVNNINEYTFGDEKQLRLVDRSTTSQNPNPQNPPTEIRTAWQFPVDTDNNGKFDSYTLYTINFRTPPVVNGLPSRARTAIEARTPPMIGGQQGGGCEDVLGTSATLVGDTGWSKVGTQLKKSFFVYTANVPITDDTGLGTNYEKYRGNQGFSAIEYQQDRAQLPLINNAVVYEDDLEITPGPNFRLNGRIITNSNLLTGGNPGTVTLYQVSSPYSCFYEPENGKIVVGGNVGNGKFTTTSGTAGTTSFHLFLGKEVDPTTGGVRQIAGNTSVTNPPSAMAYNSQAYVARINALVTAQFINAANTDPSEVKEAIGKEKDKRAKLNIPVVAGSLEEQLLRREQIETYFKKRTRRVPYAEVPLGADALVGFTGLQVGDSADTLRPPDAWIYPTTPDGRTANGTGLTLNPATGNIRPPATKPEQLDQNGGIEGQPGDRLIVGHNLPQLWWNNGTFVGPNKNDTQNISGANWDAGGGQRTRRSQVEQLADLGSTNRDRDWEIAASQIPTSPQDPVGGMRVITGAGIYLPANLTVSSSAGDFNNALTKATAPFGTDRIWSDMMPVASGATLPPGVAAPPTGINPPSVTNGTQADSRYGYINNIILSEPNNTGNGTSNENVPYLRMRASAVYHYTNNTANTPPAPIACVSSYYDPTSQQTAKNQAGLPDISLRDKFLTATPNTNLTGLPTVTTNPGNSNNGVAYGPPSATETTYSAVLDYQAKLKYPNGRWANEPLRNALFNPDGTAKAAGNRTLADLSAIDSALCALQILDNTIGAPDDAKIPHGAIYETAFLDGRQVKAIHKDTDPTKPGVETFTNADGTNGDRTPTGGAVLASVPSPSPTGPLYDLPREQRQALEIRATVLDIDLLRRTPRGTSPFAAPEYLIPNSGIIYATRDDALPDQSAALSTAPGTAPTLLDQTSRRQASSVDFILDPTRRPNAIVLTNGDRIWRTQTFREAERGLILASNVPVYVHGTFNRHTQQEFINNLDDAWGNFYTRTKAQRNTNFACRPGDARLPNCTVGDEWRPASVIADAVTLLSNNFRFGYRNEGDYDLNNNLGNDNSINFFRRRGFLNNAGVPNASWYKPADGFPKDFLDTVTINGEDGTAQAFQGSSYLNNLVIPVQRRVVGAPEYLMEVCLKIPASACLPNDWFVQVDLANLNDPTNGAHRHSWDGAGVSGQAVEVAGAPINSGTTAILPPPELRRFPRRVAFKRIGGGNLVGANNNPLSATNPISATNPLVHLTITGADGSGTVQVGGTARQSIKPGLWFALSDGGNPSNDPQKINNYSSSPLPLFTAPPFGDYTTGINPSSQPLLRPVFQLQRANPITTSDADPVGPPNKYPNNWMQPAVETTFNLVSAAGDTPARPIEDNGGLHNFVRFLEDWNSVGDVPNAFKARISGSFIQFKRSSYATAPLWGVLNAAPQINAKNMTSDPTNPYALANDGGRVGYYIAPNRQWGYDVGLLSQSPDLFAQKLVKVPDDRPDEFFREVGRDDDWVKALLCSNTWEQTTSVGGLPQPTDQGAVLSVNPNIRQSAGCTGRFE